MAKIGPNDPCPCESGNKYKKCCNAPLPNTLTEEDFHKEVAYIGKSGLARKVWCEKYIAWKEKIFHEVENRFAGSGYSISCSEGCSYCCTQYIGAYIQDCDAIVYWLYQRPVIMKMFLDNYAPWRETVGDLAVITEHLQRHFANLKEDSHRDAFLAETAKYGRQNVPCPFLKDNMCLIYPVRPLVCATHVVTSPPKDCKPDSKVSPVVIQGGGLDKISPPRYFVGEGMVMVNMPKMVYHLLTRGYRSLEEIPGVQGLLAKVWAVPRVGKLWALVQPS